MPIFNYSCVKCKITEEKLILTSSPPPICPNCKKEMEKLFSASGQSFRLYGEGFEKRNHRDTGEFS